MCMYLYRNVFVKLRIISPIYLRDNKCIYFFVLIISPWNDPQVGYIVDRRSQLSNVVHAPALSGNVKFMSYTK